MFFPVSGVEVSPLVPPLVSFLISSITASSGVSGGLLILPFQVSVLNYVTPSVSSTNLIYNISAIPGGLYRYIKEGRMVWALTWVILVGSLPGMFAGVLVRVKYLRDPGAFKMFAGIVLLYLGIRLLVETVSRLSGRKLVKNQSPKNSAGATTGNVRIGRKAFLPPNAVISKSSLYLFKIEYEFLGEKYSVRTATLVGMALVVGLFGGIYGIGGGAIIAPFCVSYLGLPIYTVAGAALAGTFLTSLAGVFFYSLHTVTAAGMQAAVAPDWALGLLFGVGGFVGSYVGARLQKFLPERLIRGILGMLVTFLGLQYIIQYFL